MAAKVWGTQQRAIDEIFFQNEAVSLCLLVNRRARTMRVIDFRAGPTHAKRLFVLSLAQREGMSKVYTLVERDEVPTWLKLGFAKEGTIPGFYKRSDAFLLGCSAVLGRKAADRRDLEEVPIESQTRIAVGSAPPMTAAQQLMERTIATAKRALKDDADALPHAKVAPAGEAQVRKAVAAALRSGRALTGFETFGRDVARRHFVATAKGGFELYASIEGQECFSNAFVELLQSPRTEAEKTSTMASLRVLCDMLVAEGAVSCFSLAPSDDVALASAYLQNGFRRTGLLHEHLAVRGERRDAIVWSRRLSNPGDD
jgi:hypothetical protein